MLENLGLEKGDKLAVIGELEIPGLDNIEERVETLRAKDWNQDLKDFNKAIIDLFALPLKETVKKLIELGPEEALLVLTEKEACELTSEPKTDFFTQNTIRFKLFYKAETLFKENQESFLLVSKRNYLSMRDKVAQYLIKNGKMKVRAALINGLLEYYPKILKKDLSKEEAEEVVDNLDLNRKVLEIEVDDLRANQLLEVIQLIYGMQFCETS